MAPPKKKSKETEAPKETRSLAEAFKKIRSNTQLQKEYDAYVKDCENLIEESGTDIAIMTFEEFSDSAPKLSIPTGIISFDAATKGGFPCGRIAEVFGPESSCKTTLAMLAMDNTVRMNGGVLYNDAEGSCDHGKFTAWKAELYVKERSSNLNKWWEMIHDTLNDLTDVAFSKKPIAIVWDSIPATMTEAGLKGDVGEKAYGGHGAAAMHSDELTKTNSLIRKALGALIAINQLRDNIKHDASKPTSEEDKTPGGRAWKFWATLRVRTQRTGKNFYWDPAAYENSKLRPVTPEGFFIKANILKNKVGLERVQCEFPIVTVHNDDEPNSTGPELAWAMFDYLKEAGIIEAAGSRMRMKGLDQTFFAKDWRTLFIELAPLCLDLIADPANKCGVEGKGFAYSPEAREAVLAHWDWKYGHLRAEAKKMLKRD